MKITDGDRLIDYTGVQELRGPLAVVAGVDGVGWDEYVSIILPDGTERHGLVLDVDHDLAVIQVLEGTAGIDPANTEVRFSGEPLRVPVGTAWLGRTCNGRGEPIDGGPPVTGHAAGFDQRRSAQSRVPRSAGRTGVDRRIGA